MYEPASASDVSAGRDLLAAYAWLIDDGRWSDFGEVFTAEADCDYEAFVCHGASELGSWMERIHAGMDATQHLIGSVWAQPSDSGLTVRSHVQATLVKRGHHGGSTLTVGARYDDRVVRTADGWRIAQRRTRGLWMRGNRDIVPWVTSGRGSAAARSDQEGWNQ